ncbi:MAG: YicC family protein [Bacteroidales bacterium]|nr:YicC family protein [Candidatus Scybalousia scybalohippi]
MKSMTGYGKVCEAFDVKNIIVEIRTLNSKQADISVKLPPLYRSKEIEINNILKTRLERGKIDCYITVAYSKGNAKIDINENLFKSYYEQLRQMTNNVGADSTYLTQYVLQRDDVSQSENNELKPEEADILLMAVNKAVDAVDNYRQVEGKVLKEDFIKRVNLIHSLADSVEPFEKQRVPAIKEKLMQRLEELQIDNIDNNRLEQELIYYLEKLDVTEERVRLAQHIKYFLETIEIDEAQGKKLGFIVQEMGREINTLGSKSNDAEMQKIVVKMKDELEKIKEQLANAL